MEAAEILAVTPEGVAEGELIDQSKWGAIRTLWESGKSKKAIARELSLDIKTVRKWVKTVWRPQQRRRGRRLDGFAEFLKARAPEVGFNAVVLARELSGRGYSGTYSAVVKYVAPWRKEWRGQPEPTVRFETGPGEQSQVDWGSTAIFLGEERVRIHIFTMVLGYSRRIFARVYSSEGLDALLDAHEKAFSHFGGRTRTILYDNPRTIVTKKNEQTGEVVWNRTFADRMDFYGVKVKLCRYYRAQTKGKVESGVKYVKGNALLGRRFADLEELNAYLLNWCVTIADTRIHGTTHEVPAERFARGEVLIPVDLRPVPPRERYETRIVPRDAYVAVDTNRYPVPFEWVGREVSVHILATEVVIRCDGCPGSSPVRHRRLEGRHQVVRHGGTVRAIERREQRRTGPPRLDPVCLMELGEVVPRPLSSYEELAVEVGR
jgi:transposase